MREEGDGGVTSANGNAEFSKIRIFVGGLGRSVTEIDLRSTFSSTQMGLVDSVEIVRSKGRSFAYLDFVPFSDKGLSKLFSKYNGCTWKGGKLKLEKAKEHYFTRLKREWAEDTAICSNPEVQNADYTENSPNKKMLKTGDSEKIYLQLFFPRLQKIKQIPYKGTGKHKYSFQHITVPALASHFCDCEEHSIAYKLACHEASAYANKEGFGMDKEELNTMNSVLSKILAREGTNSTGDLNFSDIREDRGGDNGNLILNLVTRGNDLHISDTEEHRRSGDDGGGGGGGGGVGGVDDDDDDDDDNMIINIVAGGNNRISLSDINDRYTNRAANKVSQASKKEPENTMPTIYNKKRKATSHENLHGDRSTKSPWSHIKSDNPTFHLSDIITQNSSHIPNIITQNSSDDADDNIGEKMENKKFISLKENEQNNSVDVIPSTTTLEVATAAAPTANKNVTRNTWIQKSPWMQLVGEPNNSTFSISQVLSGVNPENQELLPMKKSDELSTTLNDEHPKLDNNLQVDVSLSQAIMRRNGDNDPIIKESSTTWTTTVANRRNPSKLKQASRGGRSVRRVDPNSFVRSAASMKEWKKAKETLSKSLK